MSGPAMDGRAMNGPAMNGPARNRLAMTGAGRISREYTGRHRRDTGPGSAGPDPGSSTARGGWAEPDGRPSRGTGPAPGPWSEAGYWPEGELWTDAG
jgi:hypothetical protein